MSKIKTRETHKDIKALDKAAIAGERMRDAFIRTKVHTQNLTDDGQVSSSEYATDQMQYLLQAHRQATNTRKEIHQYRQCAF